MAGVTEPDSGLVFYELSHVWGHGAPTLPGYEDVRIHRATQHAKNGVMAQRLRMIMHSGTHVNAPRHLIQRGAGVGEIADGSLLRFRRRPVDPEERMAACHGRRSRGGDACDRAGGHRRHRHRLASQIQRQHRIFRPFAGPRPGGRALARRRSASICVAVDTPQVDHPLATSLGPHRNGPQMKRLAKSYEKQNGALGHRRFPGLERRPPRAARRGHSDDRERRRRCRRSPRQALHVSGLSVELVRGRRLPGALRRHS